MKTDQKLAVNRLSESVQEVWPQLSQLPTHCVLYGSTAIALRLDHEQAPSRLEFKTARHLSVEELTQVGFLREASLEERDGTIRGWTGTKHGPLEVTFEHSSRLGEINPPARDVDSGLAVASVEDLAASVVLEAADQNRTKPSTPRDLEAIANQIPLPEMVGAARAVTFGELNATSAVDRMKELQGLSENGKYAIHAQAIEAAHQPWRVSLHSQNLSLGLDQPERGLTAPHLLSESAKHPSIQLNLQKWLLDQGHELDGK